MKEKTIVLGLDGTDIRYLEEAMEERNLPNFERLKEEGTLGELTSCHPPTTVPGWNSMFTGQNPGELGYFHFQEWNKEKGGFRLVDLSETYGQYIWDTGIETSLIFLPGISPPYEIQGRVLESIPGPKDFRTYPEELADEVKQDDFMETLNSSYSSKTEKHLAGFRGKKDIAHQVLEDYEQELAVVVYRPTDAVAHFGDSMEDFYNVYETMDEELGYFMDKADEDGHNLFVVSDHGANNTERAFFVNTWLEKEGYIALNETETNTEKNLLLKAANFFIDLGFRKQLDWIHGKFQKFTGKSLKPSKHSVSDQVNWEESQAVAMLIGALPTTGIMLKDNQMADEELEDLKTEIIEKLEDRDEIKWAKPREKVYKGNKMNRMPHIVVRGKDDVMMKSMLYPDMSIKFNKYGHGYAGIFGAYGPDIKSLERTDARITDVAPTVLHSMGKKVPENIDGEVVKNIFKSDREIEYRDGIDEKVDKSGDDADEDQIKDRLEELGYMSD